MATLAFISTKVLARALGEAEKRGEKLTWITPEGHIATGVEPANAATVLDLASEEVRRPGSGPDFGLSQKLLRNPAARRTRRSGSYVLSVSGRSISSTSLKESLRAGLLALEEINSGTLEALTKVVPRSKRIVARDPRHLFADSGLSDEYAERLNSEWWIGTNNSRQETEAWLKRATEIAGLTWNKDVSFSSR